MAIDELRSCPGTTRKRRKELKDWRQIIARSTNEKLRMFQELGRVLLDTTIDDGRSGREFRGARSRTGRQSKTPAALIRPRQDGAIDFFGTRYSTIRQFAPAFLQTLTFHAHGPDDTVLQAVEVIRTLDRAPTRRPIPQEAPMGLVTDTWRPYLREPTAASAAGTMELCTLWSLRSALRAGNVWGAQSALYQSGDISDSPSRVAAPAP